MAIKALVFDNFGVLMDLVYSSLRRVLPAKARGELLGILDDADSGRIDAAEQLKQLKGLLDNYGLDGTGEIAGAIQRAERNQTLFDFILKSRAQYKTALLSNASAAIWNYYAPAELNKYFDQVVISYREKMMKPDHRIYRLTCDRLGVEPAECVFADDNANNVAAAEAVGMHGIIFTDNDHYFRELNKILAEENR